MMGLNFRLLGWCAVILLGGCAAAPKNAGVSDADGTASGRVFESAFERESAAQTSQCASLANKAASGVVIATAEIVPAGQFVAPAPDPYGPPPNFSQLPAFCRVSGSLQPTTDSDIRFELWLPVDKWNGRFMQTGNGGAAGSIVYGSLVEPLSRGYAVAHTDTGHRGGGGEFTWAVAHPERLVDYQYRAVHELTLAGKSLSTAFYGQAPEKAYWMGCSTGGRQGLKELQRYPDAYDAVIAGAPANNWSALMSLSIQIERALSATPTLVPKLGLLHKAVVAACDMHDGVEDGVISAPLECSFSAADLLCESQVSESCLSQPEVDAATAIYAGAVGADGQVMMPGTGYGSEMEWAAYASEGFRIGSSYFRNLIAKDDAWTVGDFDLDRDLPLAEAFDNGAAKAMQADISDYVEQGGKLILYHGTSDGLIPAASTVNYYNSVVDALGQEQVDASVKLYVVPGMGHCAGGAGVFAIDWLGAMEAWVEEGTTPATLSGSNPGIGRQDAIERPVCVYPAQTTYQGSGDTALAASFACQAE